MHVLVVGLVLVVSGVILLVVQYLGSRSEQGRFKSPYIKNVGFGFFLFGIYYLIKYLITQFS
jgi:hypothetical protein